MRCASATCNATTAKLYDDRTELSFCSSDCLADYIAQHSDEFAEWYAGLYVTEDD
ncbi:hypothetical protein [Terribacillus saccharophilus]|uniref:hypothetical protein n=1 Tax=Terribacillus saccharophilus TaxID=361277 RepID=UPI003D29F96D